MHSSLRCALDRRSFSVSELQNKDLQRLRRLDRAMGRASRFTRTNERVLFKVRGGRGGGCRDLASSSSTRKSGYHLTSNKKTFPADFYHISTGILNCACRGDLARSRNACESGRSQSIANFGKARSRRPNTGVSVFSPSMRHLRGTRVAISGTRVRNPHFLLFHAFWKVFMKNTHKPAR